MNGHATHRLDGLEPDNLLAFMALLGLLRALEEARSNWHPRVSWTVDEPPLRPCLHVVEEVSGNAIVETAAEGLAALARHHDFDGLSDLTLLPDDAEWKLQRAADSDPYTADLWAALVSDAAVRQDGKVERTPLCLLSGQGRQHFLSRLASVPQETIPLKRGSNRKRPVPETECLNEALFMPWKRPDEAKKRSFRWDPHEDVRHASRARDPTDKKTKEGTQHGANRLASVGLSVFTVVPRQRSTKVNLAILGGGREPGGDHTFSWPIWREPISLTGIRALLGHPHLDRPEIRRALGIVELRRARRISVGKYMNVTRAETVSERG